MNTPKHGKSEADEQAKDTNGPVLCFEVGFDEAVYEGCEPKQPLQASH